MTIEEKLKHFLDVTVESANEKSVKSMEDYQKGLEAVLETHKEDALRKQALQLRLNEENLRKEKNGAVSKQQMEIKKEIGKKHEELKTLLFHEVEDKLEAYMDTEEYDNYLISCILDAKEFAGEEEMIVYIDPADSKRQFELEAATNARIMISEYSFRGGVRAVIRSKNILIDHSFETKLNEAKSEFAF